MIFKTFDDGKIDKWTAKIGIFGKSFNELGTAINNAFQSTINNIDNFDNDIGFWKSLKDNLFPKKEDIQSKMIDVDALIPKIDDNTAQGILGTIREIEDGVHSKYKTFQELYDTGDKQNQWIAEYAQNTKGQIRSTEGVIQANQQARESAIAYNNGLKQMTIGAKAANFALGALKNVLNVAVSYLVSWGISKLIQTITDHIHRAEKAVKKMGEAIQKVNSVQKEYSSNAKSLSEIEDRFVELSKGVNSFSENMKLSENEYQEYLNLSAKLADLSPDMIYGYNSQGEALLKIGDNAIETKEKLEELRKEQEKQKNQEIIDNGNDIAEGLYYDNKSRRREIEKKEVIIQASEGLTNFDNIIRPNNSHGSFAFNLERSSRNGASFNNGCLITIFLIKWTYIIQRIERSCLKCYVIVKNVEE